MTNTTHSLVPRHEVLSAGETEELLQRLRATSDKLPKVFVTDPQAKAVNAKIGDVLKIIRTSPTAGEAIYYRVVIDA